MGSLTFKGDICPIVQKDFSRLDQTKLSDLQQGVAHAFVVKSRLGFAFQQLLENQKFALVFGRRPGAFTNGERLDEYERRAETGSAISLIKVGNNNAK